MESDAPTQFWTILANPFDDKLFLREIKQLLIRIIIRAGLKGWMEEAATNRNKLSINLIQTIEPIST
jgi:hypothetical protein